MIPIIGPILGMIDGFDSADTVLRCLNLSGLAGFKLSEADNFSHKTRKRAYLQQAEEMMSAMTEDDQWRFAVAAAQFLREHDESGEIVPQTLQRVGWKFDGERFTRIDQPEHAQPVFFPAGDTHDAYVHVRGILQTAKGALLIVDPWLGPRIYALIATVNDLKTCRLLCRVGADADFVNEAEVFAKQYAGLTLEIRGAKDFHDRFVFADGKLYLFGASIERAGQRDSLLFRFSTWTSRTLSWTMPRRCGLLLHQSSPSQMQRDSNPTERGGGICVLRGWLGRLDSFHILAVRLCNLPILPRVQTCPSFRRASAGTLRVTG